MGKKEYIECICKSPEHRLVLTIEEFEDEKPELYFEVHLNQPNNFFKRIWIAIKYMFGYKCKYGHFDCTIIKSEDIPDICGLMHRFNDLYNKWENKGSL